MSWSDIFFPGNQEKRDEITRLSAKVYHLIEQCFLAINKLVDIINRYIPGREFGKEEMDATKSIRYNCNVIIDRLGEVERYLEKAKINAEKQMDPEIFKKLVTPDTSFMEKIKIAKSSSTSVIRWGETVLGIIVCGAITNGKLFVNITKVLGVLETCQLASIVLGVLALGLDMIASAIIGAIESSQLDDALNEYQRVVREFQPAAEEFYDNISLVKAMIELPA